VEAQKVVRSIWSDFLLNLEVMGVSPHHFGVEQVDEQRYGSPAVCVIG